MKYENKLSKLRHLLLKVQGQDLTQVLLRAAAARVDSPYRNVHSAEEIFSELKLGIYDRVNEMSWEEAHNIVTDANLLNELKDELIENPMEPFDWDETLFILLEGTEGNHRKLLETVLTNQYHHIKESDNLFSSHSPNDSMQRINKLLLPIVRRIYNRFEVGKLVGVQPMNGPVGMSYLLRYKEEEQKVDEQHEQLFGVEEGRTYKKISAEIIGANVEARTYRLRAGWAMEAAQDLKSMHGLDIESEMMQAMAQEAQAEINALIIYDLQRLAGDPREVEIDADDPEALLKLGCEINKACTDIAMKTRRGAGNWIVVSPTMLSMLEDIKKGHKYKKNKTGEHGLFGTLMEVGTFNETIKVFSSLAVKDDEILVGYKGTNGETDAGYIYCPYVPMLSSGVVLHPETFQPIVGFMTRDGKVLNGVRKFDDEGEEIKSDSLTLAENYYNLIKIEGLIKEETTDEE